MELLDHMIVLVLIFWRLSLLFSLVTPPIYFPTKVHKSSLFSTSSPTLVIGCLFDNSHSDRCMVISHCGFDLHFPDDEWHWAYFHVPVTKICTLFSFKEQNCIFCCCKTWECLGNWVLSRPQIQAMKVHTTRGMNYLQQHAKM